MFHLWLLLAAATQVVWSRQEFLRQPVYTEVNPGETARLECSVLNKRGQCGWQKDRKPQGLFPGKYEWNGDQERGDCGLRILNARLDIDDGLWECQVTASSFEEQDVLSSLPAQLVVREAPQAPAIEYLSRTVAPGENITVVAGQNASIACVSRNGNPAAVLHWHVGHDDVTASSGQSNQSEAERPKLWQAVSTLHYTFTKEHNGLQLKCVALHDAYERKALEASVILNVQYVPTILLDGKPTKDIRDGVDAVRLQCQADANPPAFIMWRKDGYEMAASEVLQFSPVRKENSGVYSCEARNSLGSSEVLTAHLDVKFYPENVRVVPHLVEARVYNQTSLRCIAEGNPPPRYIWLFSSNGDPNNAQMLGNDDKLFISNVTYEVQGTYVCIATNAINGKEKAEHSQEVKMNVFGVPQILRSAMTHGSHTAVEKGEDAILVVPFCSDPPPSIIVWHWGTRVMRVGEGKDKFIAEQISASDKRIDCYEARLVIQQADTADARRYVLTVENDRGNDSIAVTLDVSEPVSMTSIIGIVIACLVVLVVVVFIILYAFRAEKWCFQKKDLFSASDVECDSPEKNSSRDTRHGAPRAIPPDALYTLPPKRFIKSDDESGPASIHSDDGSDTKNHHPLDMDLFPDVEVMRKADSRPSTLPRKTRVEYAEIQYRPQAHEIADI